MGFNELHFSLLVSDGTSAGGRLRAKNARSARLCQRGVRCASQDALIQVNGGVGPAGVELHRNMENEVRRRDFHSKKKSAALRKCADLIELRSAALGLDLESTDCCDRKTLNKIKKCCAVCGSRKTCAADLKRDRYDPVWRTYCLNAAVLMALAEAWWPRIYPGTWGGREARTDHEVE